jgi:hypothetical protein
MVTEDNGQSYTELPMHLVSCVGAWGSSFYYLADVEGHVYQVDAEDSGFTSLSDSDIDERYRSHVGSDNWNPATTVFSFNKVEDGKFPPPSELQYVLNSEIPLVADGGSCNVHVYLTSEWIVWYTHDHSYKTQWGESIRVESLGAVVEDAMCEDKCLVDNVYENCNKNGICVRETGECLCNYGYTGSKCEDRNDWHELPLPSDSDSD